MNNSVATNIIQPFFIVWIHLVKRKRADTASFRWSEENYSRSLLTKTSDVSIFAIDSSLFAGNLGISMSYFLHWMCGLENKLIKFNITKLTS